MCGIWTLIDLQNSNKNNIDYHKYFMETRRRGPDNSVFQIINNSIYIGFHRLSIMDITSVSNQPFVFSDENKTIIFICNGEIYNHLFLKKKYNLDSGKSDCKVILELYKKLDISKFLHLFKHEIKGVFSFTLLELDSFNNIQRLLVGRDMIGVRPVYYSISDHEIFISSELKGSPPNIKNISEFPPGNICNITFNDINKIDKKEYYSFEWIYDIKPDVFGLSESYYLKQIRNSVIRSVKRRLISDQPISFLVSGGVDSSLVAGIASKILKHPINTFCCGMKGGTDLKYSKLVSKHINSNHTEVFFTKDEGFKAIKNVIYATETWDTTTIRASVGQYLVSKYISKHTNNKVVFVGEGPDEVCSSYLFNFYAPNGDELHKCAIEYVKNLHIFDCKRSDRCISYWGLESRVPFLDPEVIEAYWKIPSDWRHPNFKGIEKWWLRAAFDGLDILPKDVLWRKKEAFSDGVSSKTDSWYETIQQKVNTLISDGDVTNTQTPSKEAAYYKKIFVDKFGKQRINILSKYWLPKWDEKKNIISKYVDPSARVLNIYQNKK